MSKGEAKKRAPRSGRGSTTKNRAGNWQVRYTDPDGKRRAGGTFRQNIARLLDHKAKAMVVTGSRKEAVRYKLAFDAYIKEKGYEGLKALVAFSGQVFESESGVEAFTEQNMNPDVKGMSLPEAFKTDDYQVMLVANKFQTGFDQPLLVAMYVDKKLSGVTAVQTLSRLNRRATGIPSPASSLTSG